MALSRARNLRHSPGSGLDWTGSGCESWKGGPRRRSVLSTPVWVLEHLHVSAGSLLTAESTQLWAGCSGFQETCPLPSGDRSSSGTGRGPFRARVASVWAEPSRVRRTRRSWKRGTVCWLCRRSPVPSSRRYCNKVRRQTAETAHVTTHSVPSWERVLQIEGQPAPKPATDPRVPGDEDGEVGTVVSLGRLMR